MLFRSLVNPKANGRDREDLTPTTPTAAGEEARVTLRPLLALKPYLLRHKGILAAALAALIVAAVATLAVPLAVRRMIEVGFSGIEPDLMDK